MQNASVPLDDWPGIISHVASLMDLDVSAREHRALIRKRGVRSAADLLHLALLYGPGRMSLRATAGHATTTGIADLCDVSLLERLRNAPAFLEDVLSRLLADRLGTPPADGGLRLSLVDGSTVSAPGSDGSDGRLHARYEPARNGFTDLALTPARHAEALCCVAVQPGDVVLCDRGYARVRNFAHARAQGADFITRIGWRSVKLYDLAGQSFDLVAALPAAGQPVVEHAVRIGSGKAAVQARLILARKPADATLRQQQKVQRGASRKGRKTDPRTLQAAGYMMLLTSLAAERASADQVLALYRMRWQIELAFKRLKSLSQFDELRADDPKLARAWLLAHLIAAVLIETSLGEDLDSPPLSRRHRRADACQVSGGLGKLHIAACSAPSTARRPDASTPISAPPPNGAFENHHAAANPKPKTQKTPYPSAHGVKPPARRRHCRMSRSRAVG